MRLETEMVRTSFSSLSRQRSTELHILVTDSEEDDAECLILKETGVEEQTDKMYEIVEDDTELLAVSKVFEELLEDVSIEM